MKARHASFLMLVLAALFMPRPAHASGLAYPAGSYARIARERVVAVWDAPRKTEHLVIQVEIDGDAREVALLVPAPGLPELSAGDDAVARRVSLLVPGPAIGADDGPAPARLARLGMNALRTGSPAGADALGAFLAAHGFANRPGLRAWARGYLDKGWSLVAIRYGEPPAPPPAATSGVPIVRRESGPARRLVGAPAIRLSFQTDSPLFPYTEPLSDLGAEGAFLARYGTDVPHPVLEARRIDAWLVSDGPRRAAGNAPSGGLPLVSAVAVRGLELGLALESEGWPFDATVRAEWPLMHFRESVPPSRFAFDDLTFEPAADVTLGAGRHDEPSAGRRDAAWSTLPLVAAAAGGAVAATAAILGVLALRRRRRA